MKNVIRILDEEERIKIFTDGPETDIGKNLCILCDQQIFTKKVKFQQ